jgi:hypothetical protein
LTTQVTLHAFMWDSTTVSDWDWVVAHTEREFSNPITKPPT